jgi:hypothetical protein
MMTFEVGKKFLGNKQVYAVQQECRNLRVCVCVGSGEFMNGGMPTACQYSAICGLAEKTAFQRLGHAAAWRLACLAQGV